MANARKRWESTTSPAAANLPIPYFRMKQQEHPDFVAAPPLSGYSQSPEMSAMIAALSHVASGNINGGSAPSSSSSPAYSPSTSASWVSRKRRHNQEAQFSDHGQRVYPYPAPADSIKSGFYLFIFFLLI